MNVMGRKRRVVGTKCTIALITIFVAGVVWYLGMRNFSSRATTAIVRKSKTGPLRKSLDSENIIVGKFEQKISTSEGVKTDHAMENALGKDAEQEALESTADKEAELEATDSNVKESDARDFDETASNQNTDKSSALDENEVNYLTKDDDDVSTSEISGSPDVDESVSQGENDDETDDETEDENSDENSDDNSDENSDENNEGVATSSDSYLQGNANDASAIPVEDNGEIDTKQAPPKQFNNVFFSRPENGQVSKILLGMGWQQSDNPEKASILWYQKKQHIPWDKLSKWQRPNHLPSVA